MDQKALTTEDVLSKAFKAKIIDHEQTWLMILKDRNLSVHTYVQELAEDLVGRIKASSIQAFQKLRTFSLAI